MPDMWWEEAKDGEAPNNAIICGHTSGGEKLYVARGYADGDLIPGYVHPTDHCCYVSHNGAEHALSSYEVLVSKDTDKFEWVSATDGTVPSGAIVGGKITANNEELFVARGIPIDEPEALKAGKLHPSNGCFYYAHSGRENSLTSYEVLCEKSSFCTIL